MTSFPESHSTVHAISSTKSKTIISYRNAALFIIAISVLLRLIFIGYSTLLVEEAYYWNYAQHLDFGYLDHPPMVALLIKLTTVIFGTHEFGVRCSTMLCWGLTAFFSFKLTNLIERKAGIYAIMLLAILPFFFLHSLVITPDQPLVVCWSATIYCLYRSLVLNESKYWYAAGIWLGLGMLSKYTIVLLGPATLIYMCAVPSARHWFARKEPYICAVIAALLFMPVIYWNATHEWASFVFQSTRRFEAKSSFCLYQFIGLLIFFLMPTGLLGLWTLLKRDQNGTATPLLDISTKRFLQIFTLVPLSFFAIVSLNHSLKFNWIGPAALALIPWLAVIIKQDKLFKGLSFRKSWLITGSILSILYTLAVLIIMLGTPEIIYEKLFKKFIAWDNLTEQVYIVAKDIEAKTGTTPIIVPLDSYNIASELSFYQTKFLLNNDIPKNYPIIGRHIFGGESLMYRYWSPENNFAGKPILVISNNLVDFNISGFKTQAIAQSPMMKLWSHSQVRGADVNPFYYQVVQISAKSNANKSNN